ncbi:CehA/McbA family metallohydrolase [Isoalcanivorax beigongshangi]|uniref:CehA/McbA family metallohydrolase n=1 Tax=Isoalcanivorax beigongshangi TaxID=3238810 RepID=A0ABV4AG39_9GAMM
MMRHSVLVVGGMAALTLTACGGGSNNGGSGPTPTAPIAAEISVVGLGRVATLDRSLVCAHGDCGSTLPAPQTVAAEAGDGQRFSHWSDADCGSELTCTLGDQALTAVFEPLPAQVPSGQWLGGDLHVHTDHSSDGSMPRQTFGDAMPGNVSVADQIGQALKSGLDFLSLTDHRTHDQHYDPLWESPALLLIRGEEANGKPHSTVHGAVDMLTQPAVQPGRDERARLQQSIWDAHSQNAIWVSAHPEKDLMHDNGELRDLADAVGVDLVETWNNAKKPDQAIDYAENRWNAGYRFSVAGASDNHFRELWLTHGPGSPTTRVHADAANQQGLLHAMQRGHTHIGHNASGPFVTLDADFGDGYTVQAGDEAVLPAGTRGTLRLRLEGAKGQRVLVYRSPGRSAGAVTTLRPSKDYEVHHIEVESSDAPQWYRVEVRSPLNQLRGLSAPLFVGPAPVQPQTPWLPATSDAADGANWVLGADGAFTGFPDAAASDGILHVVAEQHHADGTRVLYQRRDTHGSWQPQPLAVSGTDRQPRFARIAARGQQVAVVWQEITEARPLRSVIRLRQSDDGGRSWGAAETVHSVAGRAEHPVVALHPQGQVLLAWQQIQAGDAFDIWFLDRQQGQAENLSAEGKITRPAERLDSRSSRYPASLWPTLAVSENGDVAVGWQDNRTDPDPLWTGTAGVGEGTNPDNWQIQLRRRTTEGDWQPILSVGADDAADQHPSLAYSGAGDLLLAWNHKPLKSSGASFRVATARIQGDAIQLLPPLDDHPAPQQRPRLGAAEDGSPQLVWYHGGADDWRWKLASSRWQDGEWSAARWHDGPGNNSWPVVAGNDTVFVSSRDARRLQRDPTHQIMVMPLTGEPH